MEICAVADILMGFYLFGIAIQDLQYREMYHQYAHEWMSSLGCTFVGIMAMISTEVTCAASLDLMADQLITLLAKLIALIFTFFQIY